jgi:hypothetical protein
MNADQSPSFDAKVLLNITANQNYGGRFTCMGTTKQGRRCRNPRTESIADDTLDRLPQIRHDRELLEDTLDGLGYDVYCHRHRYQAPKEQWVQIIREEAWECRSSRRSTGNRIAARALPSSQPASNEDSHILPCSPCLDASTPSHTMLKQIDKSNERSRKCGGITEADKEEAECPICLMPFSESCKPCETSCGHRFCLDCIDKWLSGNKTCPLDRKGLRKRDLKLVPWPRAKTIALPPAPSINA